MKVASASVAGTRSPGWEPATTARETDLADLALLTGPWERVLLLTPIPRTPSKIHAPPPRGCPTLVCIDGPRWKTARREAVDGVAGPQLHVYAVQILFWDCAAVAELAIGQRPTDPLLADALWGAAVVTLHAERLPAMTSFV